MEHTRRELLAQTARLMGVFGLGMLAWRCGAEANSDDNPDDGTADCTLNGTSVTIGGNHGHSLVVSAADVVAGVEKAYDVQGTSAHTHFVTVTAAHFVELQTGRSVVVTSTEASAHTHSVTVSCA